MPERPYEFRRRLNCIHRPGRRDADLAPASDEIAIGNGWRISVAPEAGACVLQVARDLQDYLFTSMDVSALLVRGGADVSVATGDARTIRLTTRRQSPGPGAGLTTAGSYRIVTDEAGVLVCGCDERGTAQGCYHLEDLMNLREAPYLARGDVVRSPLFSPRMVHSGWGIDQYPDPHLSAIAHAGMDAILLFVKGVDESTTGYVDINDLIDRAAVFGHDVYLYSYLVSRVHPSDPEARAWYESTYGALMASCPRARGIVLVGESCEFPSRDPRTTGRLRLDPAPDGKPDARPSPGWWPCTDYPQWLDLLKDIIRRHNPEADIVFWTYNWGWAPEADRLALIRALPRDITLQATFEMFEDVEKQGIDTRCVDYTVSFEGPGRYFSSEAEAAHQRGLRLYTMSNTAGLTWDIGVIPYEPVPFQWARRHEALLDAQQRWGLTGLMESHHYGWWPSVASELAKWCCWQPRPAVDDIIARLARRDFGPVGGPLAVEAWQAWSDAIRDYVPTNEDQYGPFRVGPSYPLVFRTPPPPIPSAPHAHFGSSIVNLDYRPHRPEDVPTEIALLQRMLARWEAGLVAMGRAVEAAPAARRAEAQRMLGLGRFIRNCVLTTIHTKQWWLLRERLGVHDDVPAVRATLDDMVRLGEAEAANAADTIPLVASDSRLGWEPSMEYMTDVAHLEWKIGWLRHVLDEEIPACRREAAV